MGIVFACGRAFAFVKLVTLKVPYCRVGGCVWIRKMQLTWQDWWDLASCVLHIHGLRLRRAFFYRSLGRMICPRLSCCLHRSDLCREALHPLRHLRRQRSLKLLHLHLRNLRLRHLFCRLISSPRRSKRLQRSRHRWPRYRRVGTWQGSCSKRRVKPAPCRWPCRHSLMPHLCLLRCSNLPRSLSKLVAKSFSLSNIWKFVIASMCCSNMFWNERKKTLTHYLLQGFVSEDPEFGERTRQWGQMHFSSDWKASFIFFCCGFFPAGSFIHPAGQGDADFAKGLWEAPGSCKRNCQAIEPGYI